MPYYYPADSVYNIKWAKWGCAGYINARNASATDAANAYAALQKNAYIIIDQRNYPLDNTVRNLMGMMLDKPNPFYLISQPDLQFPGVFKWSAGQIGYFGNPTPYEGTIILLFNEYTQSAAEFNCMMVETAPKVIKIGSQTAGADGNVTKFALTQNHNITFTTLGVYYPDTTQTQRLGIIPDINLTPTIKSIREGRDELLEKAIEIACNASGINNEKSNPQIQIKPNPASTKINITVPQLLNGLSTICVTDITGKIIYKQTCNFSTSLTQEINIHDFLPGIYFVNISNANNYYLGKLVKN